MNTSDHFQAIQLNNVGAYYIAHGNFMDAVTSLSNAHQLCRRGFDCYSAHQDILAADTRHYCLDRWMAGSHIRSDEKKDSSSDDQTFVYRQPIQLPRAMPASFDSFGTVSVAIIFNLALAHHLFGLQESGSLRVQLLQKASKLYRYSCMLHLKKEEIVKQRATFLLMATNNNLGQLHQVLGDVETAESCYHELLSALMYCVSYRDQNLLSFEGFFQSTAHWISKNNAAAAA